MGLSPWLSGVWRQTEQKYQGQEHRLASPERHPGDQSLRIGLSSGERAWAGAGATVLASGRAALASFSCQGQDQARLARGPEGPGGRSGATSGGAHLALFLDTMSWTASRLGRLTGNSGWQRVRAAGQLGGRAAWPKQRTFSYTMSCHLGQGEDQLVWEGDTGPGTLWAPQQSLPTLCLSFPIPPPIAIS